MNNLFFNAIERRLSALELTDQEREKIKSLIDFDNPFSGSNKQFAEIITRHSSFQVDRGLNQIWEVLQEQGDADQYGDVAGAMLGGIDSIIKDGLSIINVLDNEGLHLVGAQADEELGLIGDPAAAPVELLD